MAIPSPQTAMDTRIGLDYIVENKEYTEKIATALDTNNVTVKKQVFALLSALCAYNASGYQRALEALQRHKNLKNCRYRLKVVVDELRQAQSQDLQTAIASFVNSVIVNAPSVKERIRIRNEFIGLKLLDVFHQFRRDCNGRHDTDLAVQLDAFDEQKYTDEGQLSGPDGVDLSCHLDVFYAIFRQVSTSPLEIPFLSILQHLLRVDPSQPISDIIWDIAEKLVHRATLCETKEDAEKLLRTPSYHHSLNKFLRGLQESGGRCMCSCHKIENADSTITTNNNDGRIRKRTPLLLGLGSTDGSKTPGILSPTNSVSAFSPELLASLSRAISPPPCNVPKSFPPSITDSRLNQSPSPVPPSSGCPPPPPPPPPPPGCTPPPPPPPPGCPPPPPPPPLPGIQPPQQTKAPLTVPEEANVKLPQQFTPKPKNKMKSLNWNKIPSNKVVGKKNLWSLIAKTHDSTSNDLDFETMEGLFCQANGQQSPNLSSRERSPTDSLDRKKKESTEINLLDGKRSLNVNIFLKQFRSSNEDIIRLLKEGAHEVIGAEKLRGLLKILPEADEVELLKGFKADKDKLGTAENFLLLLIQVPSYKLRCESMLLKEEFASNMAYLEPAVESIATAVEEIKQCRELHEVMYLLLLAGNFLNSGGYAGDAAGFKMMSLLKITDTRANKPGMNLIHYVAQESVKKFPNLLKFPELLPSLEDASKLSIDNLKSEIGNLSQRVSKVSQQVAVADANLQQQMDEFLQLARSETNIVRKDIENLDKVREETAEFLCEDSQSFKLEECFKIFYGFCQKFKTAVEENEHRRQQEKRAESRRKQREEQLTLKKKKNPDYRLPSYSGSESDNIMDMLLGGIPSGTSPYDLNEQNFKTRKARKPEWDLNRMNSLTSSLPSEEDSINSPKVIKRRMGSMNSVVTNGESGEFESPDITPNGTMRRRRTRLSSDDHDDNLMDFLRQNAEMDMLKVKPMGSDSESLDRSLLRKSSRSRRRADILASELNERERPASPIPSSTEKQSVTPHQESSKPRQWRKKIEDWFHENEKEQLREKKFRERVNLEKWRRQEPEQRESDSVSTSTDRTDDHKNLSKNADNLHEAKTDSELYALKLKDTVDVVKEHTPAETNQLKDKSKWRKSTLNVANSSESIDDERRRNRSRKSLVDLDFGPDETLSFYFTAPQQRSQENADNLLKLNTENSSTTNLPNEIEKSLAEEKGSVVEATGQEKRTQEIQAPISRSRFYQSLREPAFVKVEEELVKASLSDDDQLDKHKKLKTEEKDIVNNDKTGQSCKTSVADDEDKANFDRFSFMRKTTRRAKSKQKQNETNNEGLEDNKVDITEPDKQNQVSSILKVDRTPDYIETAKAHIDRASRELQNLNDENHRNQTGVFVKNNALSSKTPDMTPEEIRKRDKSTSLKARLSKRLLSLTENFKAMLPDAPEKRFPESVYSSVDESAIPIHKAKSPSPTPVEYNSSPKDLPDIEKNRCDEKIPFELNSGMSTNFVKAKPYKVSESNSPVNSNFTKSPLLTRNLKDEQDKDEGFEETQSQLSEVNSLGPFSSYETDSVDSPKSFRQIKDISQTLENKLLPDSPTDSVPSRPDINVKTSTANLKDLVLPLNKEDLFEKRNSAIVPSVKRSSSTRNTRKPDSLIIPSSTRKSALNTNPLPRRNNSSVSSNAKANDSQNTSRQKASRNTAVKTEKPSLREDPPNRNRQQKTHMDRQSSCGKLNEPIGKRMAAYTRAIRNMTSNINKTNSGLENYDVTQSMPPTPSEEDKTFIATLAMRESIEDPQQSRSASAVNTTNPVKSSSHQSSQKSSPVGSRSGSRRSSEKSLDFHSRRSSDRSLSRKSSENSIATVKSVSRRNTGTTSTLGKLLSKRSSQKKTHTTPVIPPKVRARNVKPTIDRTPAADSTRSKTLVSRSSSDACNFMKATSSSSAKVLPTRTLSDKPRTKPLTNSRPENSQNRLKRKNDENTNIPKH